MDAEPRVPLLRAFGVHHALKTIEELAEFLARDQDFRIDVRSFGEDIGEGFVQRTSLTQLFFQRWRRRVILDRLLQVRDSPRQRFRSTRECFALLWSHVRPSPSA